MSWCLPEQARVSGVQIISGDNYLSQMIRAQALISGDVQGVGFRQWTVTQAHALGLKGFVRNIADGRVEAVFEGEELQVDAMLKRAHRGPHLARVIAVQVEYQDFSGQFDDFELVR